MVCVKCGKNTMQHIEEMRYDTCRKSGTREIYALSYYHCWFCGLEHHLYLQQTPTFKKQKTRMQKLKETWQRKRLKF